MKSKLILSVLACGLAFTTVYAWKGGPYQKRGFPPVPDGISAGRFSLLTATVADKPVALRLDTATGRTWILERSTTEAHDAAGKPIVYHQWRDAIESDQLGLPDEHSAMNKPDVPAAPPRLDQVPSLR